jgi:hypothetical protein
MKIPSANVLIQYDGKELGGDDISGQSQAQRRLASARSGDSGEGKSTID